MRAATNLHSKSSAIPGDQRYASAPRQDLVEPRNLNVEQYEADEGCPTNAHVVPHDLPAFPQNRSESIVRPVREP